MVDLSAQFGAVDFQSGDEWVRQDDPSGCGGGNLHRVGHVDDRHPNRVIKYVRLVLDDVAPTQTADRNSQLGKPKITLL